jgi:hypothetical protein
MYTQVLNCKTNKYINLYSTEVNRLLDDGYTLDDLLKNIKYPNQSQHMILPKELNEQIMLLLDDVSLHQLCQTNRYMYKLYKRNSFWKQKIKLLYNINIDKPNIFTYKKLNKINNQLIEYKNNKLDLGCFYHDDIIVSIKIHPSYEILLQSLNFNYSCQFKNYKIIYHVEINLIKLVQSIESICLHFNKKFDILCLCLLVDKAHYSGLKRI